MPQVACLRCHSKKIKCSGHPDCSTCHSAGVRCEPYKRTRKSETLEALRAARSRVDWLEDQIRRHWGIECGSLPIGTCLKTVAAPSDNQSALSPATWSETGTQLDVTACDKDGEDNAANLSMVALNATGDTRFLGPSSGVFFAAFATSVARSLTSRENLYNNRPRDSGIHQASIEDMTTTEDQQAPLSSGTIEFLRQSFEMWIQPLYPVLSKDKLRAIIEEGKRQQVVNLENSHCTKEGHAGLTLFYLVMALGAINRTNTIQQMERNGELGNLDHSSTSVLSPAVLYSKSLHHFDRSGHKLQSSIWSIQVILLISIYGSYWPVGSSQWQLIGLAMRMATEIGLHHSPVVSSAPLQDEKEQRIVFWAAYSIEMGLAYNLGRPPSIGDEHITIALPAATSETMTSCHYIKHRRIQSKILHKVYCANSGGEALDMEQRQAILADLQSELEEWRAQIPTPESQATEPYPYSYWDRLYHGTTFVLHRSSPLLREPSSQSLERCIRSAGAYLDNVFRTMRNSNVPLNWMLVQGVLFAGLTMLITARTGFRNLIPLTGLSFLLVDLPAWARKCSVCLAIMNERWKDDLLGKVEAQFEALANDSLRVISAGLTSQPPTTQDHPSPNPITLSTFSHLPGSSNNLLTDQFHYQNISPFNERENFETFREFLGIDEMQALWDMFPIDPVFDGLA